MRKFNIRSELSLESRRTQPVQGVSVTSGLRRQLATACRYVGDMVPPTSIHELCRHQTLMGVCRGVCNRGVRELPPGKLGTNSSRVGPSPQFPRHEDDCRSEPVRKHRLCCSRIGRGSGVGLTPSTGSFGIRGKVLVPAESNVAAHWRCNNDPMSTNPGEERRFGCFYLRLDPVLTHR